jgi:hypothetical protein
VFGHGTLLRYNVDVENGIGQNPQTFAHQVDAGMVNGKRRHGNSILQVINGSGLRIFREAFVHT